MAGTRYAVVGGGIVGASVAYHLTQRTNDPVTVYERGELAAETTAASTAMIGVAGPEPIARMQAYGFRLYNDFFADPRANTRYEPSGRLRVTTSNAVADGFERLAADDAPLDESAADAVLSPSRIAHGPAVYVPGDELRDRFVLPALETGRIEGALYRPQYGYVESNGRTHGAQALALEFVERAQEGGVAFETHTPITAVDTDGDRVTGLEADDGPIEADEVICAAGPWTAGLARTLGLELPIDRFASPVFELRLEESLPYGLPAVKSHESGVGLHHKREDTLLVTFAPDRDDSRTDPNAVGEETLDAAREPALEAATALLPALEDATLANEWVGVGIQTPDGLPIAGRTSIEGFSLAVTSAGIQLAPAVGSVLSRRLLDGAAKEYDATVVPGRFDDRGGR